MNEPKKSEALRTDILVMKQLREASPNEQQSIFEEFKENMTPNGQQRAAALIEKDARLCALCKQKPHRGWSIYCSDACSQADGE